MVLVPRRMRRALKLPLILLVFLITSPSVWAAEKNRLRVDDYQIEAELSPHGHKLTARAKVKFTALEDLSIATFELNNGLRLTKVLDANNKPLNAERVTQDSTVRIPLPNGLSKDTTTTFTFDYEGVLESGDESPVQGLKLANIGDDNISIVDTSTYRILGTIPVGKGPTGLTFSQDGRFAYVSNQGDKSVNGLALQFMGSAHHRGFGD